MDNVKAKEHRKVYEDIDRKYRWLLKVREREREIRKDVDEETSCEIETDLLPLLRGTNLLKLAVELLVLELWWNERQRRKERSER